MLDVTAVRLSYAPQAQAPVVAVSNATFQVDAGSLFTLLGPSGCGKTTTLRAIAGLERPSSGTIVVDGQVLVDCARKVFVPPNQRGVGMVFQSYAIWPHMSVFENVAFPLRSKPRRSRPSEADVRKAVMEALEMVEMSPYEHRPATRLSGGQQQRLAFARALVLKPKLLLLDEPLSNLDAKLRESMRFELKRLQRQTGITSVYITHDQAEALAISDRIAVMNGGCIVQIGTPQSIYEQPNSHFVADFIGGANLLSAVVSSVSSDRTLVSCSSGEFASEARGNWHVGSNVWIGFRPEHVTINSHNQTGENTVEATIVERTYHGEFLEYLAAIGEHLIRARTPAREALSPGRSVTIRVDPARCMILARQERSDQLEQVPIMTGE